MKITNGFAKQADKLPKPVKLQLQSIIRIVQAEDKIIDVPVVKGSKPTGGCRKYYRIRLGNYRVGIEFN